MNQQLLTVVCVTTLSSKEVRGKKIGFCILTNLLLLLVRQYRHVVLISCFLMYLLTCVLVHPSTIAGQEDCWLLTETLIQTATLQLKVCLNVQCLALHSFTDLHPGKRHHWQKHCSTTFLSSIQNWSLTDCLYSWFIVLHRVRSDSVFVQNLSNTSRNHGYHFCFIILKKIHWLLQGGSFCIYSGWLYERHNLQKCFWLDF